MSLSLSVSMISGNKEGWYSRLSSVSSCTQGCLIEKGWSFEETPRNLFLKFQELAFVLVNFFEDAVFFGLFGFDFGSDLFRCRGAPVCAPALNYESIFSIISCINRFLQSHFLRGLSPWVIEGWFKVNSCDML